MKVLGNRVYLDMPLLPESKIELSPDLKKEVLQETATKFQKLTVFQIGEAVTNVKVGDEVYVDPNALRRSPLIEVEGKEKLVVASFDIMHIW